MVSEKRIRTWKHLSENKLITKPATGGEKEKNIKERVRNKGIQTTQLKITNINT